MIRKYGSSCSTSKRANTTVQSKLPRFAIDYFTEKYNKSFTGEPINLQNMETN